MYYACMHACKSRFGQKLKVQSLGSIGLLDAENEIHLFCLHYVYQPCINSHLSMWKNAWNSYPLRTENNLSPIQVWTRGLLTRCGQELRDMQDEQLDEVTAICSSVLPFTAHKKRAKASKNHVTFSIKSKLAYGVHDVYVRNCYDIVCS